MDKVTNDAHSQAHNHDHAHTHTPAHEPSAAATGASTIDPVCGMTVDPHKTPHRHAYHDHTYYFCGNGCRTKFAADPEKYLDKKVPAPATPPGTIYTCPMHPQIRQVGPGHLPDLRHGARTAGADCRDRAQSRARRHDATASGSASRWRSRWFVLEMGGHLLEHAHRRAGAVELDSARARDAGGAVGGWPFFVRGWQSLVNRNLNMFTLIAHRHRRRLALQRRRDRRAAASFPTAFRDGRRGRRLFRGRRGHHRAGAARPGAGAARPRADLGRDPRAARSRAEDRAPRARRRQRRGGRARRRRASATACACGPARRCRSTARSSRAARRSTNRWSPASRCR